MKNKFALALITSITPILSLAAPSSGAYVTDVQSEYTADQATSEMSNPSAILCFISNTRPDAMVNKGTYVALIDANKCDTEGASDSSNSSATGGTTAATYSSVSATSTRASATAAQISKGHLDLKEDNDIRLPVYFHLSQSEAASATVPNGVLAFNYALALVSPLTLNATNLPAGSMIVRGKISTSATTIEYAERGGIGTGQTNDVRLYVNKSGNTGSGAVEADYNGAADDATYIFGFNATHFCRSGTQGGVAVAERCFIRDKAQAIKSVWRYGVYNADGSRFDLTSPGFSVRDSAGEWGFASYYGIWFRNSPADGDTVTKASTGESYTVRKGGGKLLKYTRSNRTLDQIKNNKLFFMNQSAGSGLLAGRNYEGYWDATSQSFKIVGRQDCSNDGCFATLVSLTLTPAQLLANNPNGLGAWSSSLGGLFISSAALNAGGSAGSFANGVRVETETVVQPGEVVPALKCVADCPTAASLTAFAANPGTANPFDANSANLNNRGAGLASPVSYTWDSTAYTLKDSTNSVVGSSLLSNMTSSQEEAFQNSRFRHGIRSDVLAADSEFVPGGTMDCDGSGAGTNYCWWKSGELSTYYKFETGVESYNSAIFLVQGSTAVTFSRPLVAEFQVPSDTSKYGNYAGAPMNLQFGGFGDLWGIPGKCVDPITNEDASCSKDTRWLPSFVIEDGTAITIDGQTKYVKWLDRELRFAPAAGTAAALGITLGSTANLPAQITSTSCSGAGSDSENPCDTSSASYPGSFSYDLFKKAPSVIHGVVQ